MRRVSEQPPSCDMSQKTHAEGRVESLFAFSPGRHDMHSGSVRSWTQFSCSTATPQYGKLDLHIGLSWGVPAFSWDSEQPTAPPSWCVAFEAFLWSGVQQFFLVAPDLRSPIPYPRSAQAPSNPTPPSYTPDFVTPTPVDSVCMVYPLDVFVVDASCGCYTKVVCKGRKPLVAAGPSTFSVAWDEASKDGLVVRDAVGALSADGEVEWYVTQPMTTLCPVVPPDDSSHLYTQPSISASAFVTTTHPTDMARGAEADGVGEPSGAPMASAAALSPLSTSASRLAGAAPHLAASNLTVETSPHHTTEVSSDVAVETFSFSPDHHSNFDLSSTFPGSSSVTRHNDAAPTSTNSTTGGGGGGRHGDGVASLCDGSRVSGANVVHYSWLTVALKDDESVSPDVGQWRCVTVQGNVLRVSRRKVKVFDEARLAGSTLRQPGAPHRAPLRRGVRVGDEGEGCGDDGGEGDSEHSLVEVGAEAAASVDTKRRRRLDTLPAALHRAIGGRVEWHGGPGAHYAAAPLHGFVCAAVDTVELLEAAVMGDVKGLARTTASASGGQGVMDTEAGEGASGAREESAAVVTGAVAGAGGGSGGGTSGGAGSGNSVDMSSVIVAGACVDSSIQRGVGSVRKTPARVTRLVRTPSTASPLTPWGVYCARALYVLRQSAADLHRCFDTRLSPVKGSGVGGGVGGGPVEVGGVVVDVMASTPQRYGVLKSSSSSKLWGRGAGSQSPPASLPATPAVGSAVTYSPPVATSEDSGSGVHLLTDEHLRVVAVFGVVDREPQLGCAVTALADYVERFGASTNAPDELQRGVIAAVAPYGVVPLKWVTVPPPPVCAETGHPLHAIPLSVVVEVLGPTPPSGVGVQHSTGMRAGGGVCLDPHSTPSIRTALACTKSSSAPSSAATLKRHHHHHHLHHLPHHHAAHPHPHAVCSSSESTTLNASVASHSSHTSIPHGMHAASHKGGVVGCFMRSYIRLCAAQNSQAADTAPLALSPVPLACRDVNVEVETSYVGLDSSRDGGVVPVKGSGKGGVALFSHSGDADAPATPPPVESALDGPQCGRHKRERGEYSAEGSYGVEGRGRESLTPPDSPNSPIAAASRLVLQSFQSQRVSSKVRTY